MLFNSPEFALFLATAVFTYHLIPLGWRKFHLLAASYLFYFSWSLKYSLFLLFVTLVAFATALTIERASSELAKKRALTGAVVCVMGLLALFKYFVVLTGPMNAVVPGSGDAGMAFFIAIGIPIGISYFSFKLVSYVADVYWEKMPAERDLVSFASYVAFFPQILSGPIQRAIDFMPQIRGLRRVDPDMISSGFRLILFGFFKKLVIADRLGFFVDNVYASPSDFNSPTLLLASYGYLMQLYADFSGLTDIAIGIARLFGFRSPKNFDSPFYAPNIQQFWRRWHMTLTMWLADYVFTPLRMAFRRWGNVGLSVCILINMVAIGVWHGARLTFVAFGVIHAVYMIVSVMTLKKRDSFFKKRPALAAIRRVVAPFVTFNLVTFAIIFFRADTISDAFSVITNIAALDFVKTGIENFGKKELLIALLAIGLMECAHLLQTHHKLKGFFLARPRAVRWSAYYAFALSILFFAKFTSKEFIYFQF